MEQGLITLSLLALVFVKTSGTFITYSSAKTMQHVVSWYSSFSTTLCRMIKRVAESLLQIDEIYLVFEHFASFVLNFPYISSELFSI